MILSFCDFGQYHTTVVLNDGQCCSQLAGPH